MKRRAMAWLIATAPALLAELGAAHAVARRDVLAALLSHPDPHVLALLVVLLGTRLYLLLVAPGWLLFVVAEAVVARRGVPRRTGITR